MAEQFNLARIIGQEVSRLAEVSHQWKIPTTHIAQGLCEWLEQPLPDVIPLPPQWMEFEWPKSGEVNLDSYWREVDRERGAKWMGAYL